MSNSPHSYFVLMLSVKVSGFGVYLGEIIEKSKKEIKHILGHFPWTGFMWKMTELCILNRRLQQGQGWQAPGFVPRYLFTCCVMINIKLQSEVSMSSKTSEGLAQRSLLCPCVPSLWGNEKSVCYINVLTTWVYSP